MADIMFAGIGGQGVLTAGKILIEIAAEHGKNVSWTSEYSAEMRGGIALCRVVVSDEEIGSPYPDYLDVLCCMNEDAYDKYIPDMRNGSKVIINRSVFGQKQFPKKCGSVWGGRSRNLFRTGESKRLEPGCSRSHDQSYPYDGCAGICRYIGGLFS